jgi:acetyltransferase-like isoleucine patch superfamily enzyme
VRRLFKKSIFIFALFLTSPLIVASWLERRLSKSEGLSVGQGQLLSLVPGKFGAYLRGAYYFSTLEDTSWEVHLGFGSYVSHRGASLGCNVATGSYCVIGTAVIEEGVVVASRVSIPSGKRQHLDETGEISSAPKFEKIIIGRDSWIGEGAIILANVGKNCIVSAGAIVISEVPDNCVVGGNPARIFKRLSRLDSKIRCVR